MNNLEIVSIINAYTAQKRDNPGGIRLTAPVAWKRRVNIDKLYKAKAIIDEALQEISAKYSDDKHSENSTNSTGETIRTVKPEYLAEFTREQEEIYSQETDVDIRKVSVSELGDIELSDNDMDTLSFMLED